MAKLKLRTFVDPATLLHMNMTPLEHYQRDLKSVGFNYDPSQEAAVKHLQRLYDDLVAAPKLKEGLWAEIKRKLGMKRQHIAPVKGLYFWGGVGRGKTYLMDNFYECLPFDDKLRTHFHRFMRRVHSELNDFSGEQDPLKLVAQRLAKETRVICFDEFFVADITDAMILAGLFESLFSHGVTLVATSNIVPDGLYKNGLQRARFLPAIELIKTHTDIVNVDGGVDYRLRALEQAELFHWPLDIAADQSLLKSFESLAPEEGHADINIEIEGRPIASRWVADDVVWFDFPAVCDGPRSQNDYIELAREFHAVLISNVPQFSNLDDQARRFVHLVDEFYDRNVKLVLSAEVKLEALYLSGNLSFEFERTVSRLLEMQSHDYLAKGHMP
ncbi:MAG: cell division protein ZapE [Chitinophagales bacterium]